MSRITKSQFASALNWATQEGLKCGALDKGEWLGTAVAWSASYLCIYDQDGRMVHSLNGECGTTRELYDRARAMEMAWRLVNMDK